MPAVPQPRHRWFAALYDSFLGGAERTVGPLRRSVAGGATGRVLELGCGTGANFPYFDWQRIESLVASEPDPFMRRRAEAKLDALSPDIRARVSLDSSPAEALPFEDASFECVVATLVFCTVADLDRAVAETYRVLKPGGSLRLIEHVAADGIEGGVQQIIQPVYGWLAAGCHLHRDTSSALARAGFDLSIDQSGRLGPLYPYIVATATKPTNTRQT